MPLFHVTRERIYTQQEESMAEWTGYWPLNQAVPRTIRKIMEWNSNINWKSDTTKPESMLTYFFIFQTFFSLSNFGVFFSWKYSSSMFLLTKYMDQQYNFWSDLHFKQQRGFYFLIYGVNYCLYCSPITELFKCSCFTKCVLSVLLTILYRNSVIECISVFLLLHIYLGWRAWQMGNAFWFFKEPP